MPLPLSLGSMPVSSTKGARHKSSSPLTAGIVRRTRLLRQIELAPQARVVILVAPPASGKTCLAAAWASSDTIANRSTIVFWYQIDETDGDIATFFNLLKQVVGARLGQELALLDYRAEAAIDIAGFAAHWLRILLGSINRPPVLFVFDDVHRLAPDSALVPVIVQLVRALHDGDQVVLASRLPLPTPLAAAAKRHGFIRLSDLQVTYEEYEDFQRDLPRNELLTRDRFDAALRHSGRWMAGLPIIPAIPRANDASRDHVGAVIDRLAPEEQQALQVTAYLRVGLEEDWIHLGGETSVTALAKLQAETRLVSRLRDMALRKHDVLFEQIEIWATASLSAEDRAAARAKTGRLLLERGEPLAGVSLLVAAGCVNEAVRAILDRAGEMIDRAHNAGLREIIARLPEAERNRPAIQLWDAYAALPFASGEAAKRLRDIRTRWADRLSPTELAVAVNGEIYAALANMVLDEPLPSLLKATEQVTTQLHEVAEPLRSRLVIGRLVASLLTPAADDRHAHTRAEVADLLPTLTPESRLILGAAYVHHLLWFNGDVEGARKTHALIDDQARQPNAAHIPVVSWYLGALGLAFRDGDIEQLRLLMSELAAFARQRGIGHLLLPAYWIKAHAEALAGDSEAAEAAMRAYRAGISSSYDYHTLLATILDATIALTEGKLERAVAVGQMGRLSAERQGAVHATRQLASVLSIAFALQGNRQARDLTDYLAEAGERTQNRLYTLHADLAAAAYHHRLQQWDAFVRHWRSFVDLACSLGVRAIFGFTKEACSRIALDALRAGVAEPETRRLIVFWRLSPPSDGDRLLWPYPIEIDCLGSVRLRINGQGRDLRDEAAPQAVSLLALIAAAEDKSLPQTALADALAPDSEGDAALVRVRTAIRRLRQWIGHDTILLVRGAFCLNPALVITDIERLEASILIFSDKTRSIEVRLDAFDRALRLYRGPLLPGVSTRHVLLERDRIARRFMLEARALLDSLSEASPTEVALRRARLASVAERIHAQDATQT